MSSFTPIQFKDENLVLLDQRLLPNEEVFIVCKTIEDTHKSIKDMVVRGAPCIGFTAIFGMALWCKSNTVTEDTLDIAASYLISARPTAVNLEFEVKKCVDIIRSLVDKSLAYDILKEHGFNEIAKSQVRNQKMADLASKELEENFGNKKLNILTHCNTGFLACGSIGTALGVIEQLARENRIENVWVDETRPYLQGSRLTSYELTKLNIPHKVVVEGAATYLMENKMVDAIFVGADRIVKNGDTANKVGTANLSIISKNFNVPMYVVAPLSSFDFKTETGNKIKVELRDENEILKYKDSFIAPKSAKAFNPSFDITRGENISGIICEKGVLKKPFNATIAEISK